MVVLIIDGLSSCYVYPEYTPYAIDGSVIEKADAENMQYIFGQSCRVLDVVAPQTFTEGGHSVIATGYTKADGELVASSGTTLFDVLHENGYLTFAIMEKGDSWGLCSKQDVIIHDVENSINEPEMITEINILSDPELTDSVKSISLSVADLFQGHFSGMQKQLDQSPEGSLERYNTYNIWAIDTGIDLIELMGNEHPEQKYILTINAGAVDCAGHYKKDSGYIASIEGIDNATLELYRKCQENDIAFILTGDHGMAFPTVDSRGGHQADKYSRMKEAQKVPLVISTEDVAAGIIEGDFGHEDIAPTILEILNVPGTLKIADGTAIPLKDYVNLKVSVQEEGELTLLKEGEVLFKDHIYDEITFTGLEPNADHVLRFTTTSDKGKEIEQTINTASSIVVDLNIQPEPSTNDKSYQNPQYIVGGVLIGAVNIAGLVLIRKVLKDK